MVSPRSNYQEQTAGGQLAISDEQRRRGQALEYLADGTLKRQTYEHQPFVSGQVAQMVSNERQHPGQGVWLGEHAPRGMSALTNKLGRGGRVHGRPRRRHFDDQRYNNMSR